MSILAHLVARFGLVPQRRRPSPHPEQLSLRDWADLPAHHPRCG